MTDVCPLCKMPERRHAPECEEGVPNRVGYLQGMPVVADLSEAEEFDMIKSNPFLEPNQWHVKPSALVKLRESGKLTEKP